MCAGSEEHFSRVLLSFVEGLLCAMGAQASIPQSGKEVVVIGAGDYCLPFEQPAVHSLSS